MPIIPPSPAPSIPGSSFNAGDLISSALRKIGALAAGEPLGIDDASDALICLNDMIDAWNAERLMIFTIVRQIYNPTVLKQDYTFGPGGDINFPRPNRITNYSVLNNPSSTIPLELELVPINDEQWQQIPVKNVPGALPLNVYDDGNFPLRTLSFWPIPNVNISFVFYYWQALTQFTDLVTPLMFPPGYARALRSNLAIELGPEFLEQDTVISPALIKIAQESKAAIKSFNVFVPLLECDGALLGSNGGQYNWLADTPAGR